MADFLNRWGLVLLLLAVCLLLLWATISDDEEH